MLLKRIKLAEDLFRTQTDSCIPEDSDTIMLLKRIKLAEDLFCTQKDHTSKLPPKILSHIFSYFTIRDAVLASLVSSTWKQLCTSSMSELNFALPTMFEIPNTKKKISLGEETDKYKDSFVRGVNQFLQFYKGAQLVSFKVCFCLGRDSASDIDQWIHFALSKAVEELCLDFSCISFPFNDTRCADRSNELHIFHPVLLYGGDVSRLKLLSLHSCLLGADFHSILYRCLNLESILLRDCCLPVKLCVSGSHLRLKSLGIFYCSGMKQIELSATSLQSFEYFGYSVKFSFSTPNLEKILIGPTDGHGVRYILGKLAKHLPQIKSLSIVPEINWVGCLPKQINWFYPFRKVEQLRLYVFPIKEFGPFGIQKMIAILRACPRLQKFHLVTYCLKNYKQRRLPAPTECVHKYLKEVEIGGFFGTSNHIEFALYLLKYAPALERMVIDPAFYFYVGPFRVTSPRRTSWNEGERQKVCERLQGYSKSAVVIIR